MAVAAAAVNVFRTITQVVGVNTISFYTAPVGYTGVILLSQVTNIGESTQTITFAHRRNNNDTEITKDLAIPAGDTANLLAGKLVVETGDSLTIVGSTSSGLKFLSSVLETSNL